jgi:hypothetical protein
MVEKCNMYNGTTNDIRQCKTYKLALLYQRPGQTVNNKTFIFIGYWTWRLYTFEPWINIGQTRRLQWSIFLLVFWRQYRKRNADTYHSIIYICITYFMLKCVNLIEIRFYTYFHISSFLVLWDHCADTRS